MPEQQRRAVVLGGSRGIGAAIVRRLTSDGYEVWFTYASAAEAADNLSAETGAKSRRVDSRDRDAVRAFLGELAPLYIAVLNAGVLIGGDPMQMGDEDVDRLIDVNIRGSYFAAIDAVRGMANEGRVIFIGSSTSDVVHFPGLSAYSMTKAALQGLTRGLARDFGERGVTVNVVQPGATDTEMNPSDGPYGDVSRAAMAIKRYVKPEEVAGVVAWLASPDGAIITGSSHTIDGGMNA